MPSVSYLNWDGNNKWEAIVMMTLMLEVNQDLIGSAGLK